MTTDSSDFYDQIDDRLGAREEPEPPEAPSPHRDSESDVAVIIDAVIGSDGDPEMVWSRAMLVAYLLGRPRAPRTFAELGQLLGITRQSAYKRGKVLLADIRKRKA